MKLQTQYGEMDLERDPKTGHMRMARPGQPPPDNKLTPPPPAPTEDTGPKYRSKTEARYAGHLEGLRTIGKIREARYEAFQVWLADKTTIKADFWVVMPDMSVEIHEVKGEYIREDAWIKLKIAAQMWPWFRWFKLQENEEGQWIKTRIPSR